MLAAVDCQFEAAIELIAAKADVNAVDKAGKTALSLSEDSNIIDLLKKSGAK